MIRALSIEGARVVRAVVDDGASSNFVLELELRNEQHVWITVTAGLSLQMGINVAHCTGTMNVNVQPTSLIPSVIPWAQGAGPT